MKFKYLLYKYAKKLEVDYYKPFIKKFKINKLYKESLENYEALKSYIDVSKMKKATGKLREVQLQFLDFALEIQNLLKKDLEITPILGFGNLLGAVRHGGFIPWDDDFDFLLMREDFEKLVSYMIQKGLYFTAKKGKEVDKILRDNPNKLIAVHNYDMLCIFKGTSTEDCVQIDFFPMDFYKESLPFKELRQYASYLKEEMFYINSFKGWFDFIRKELKTSKYLTNKSNKIFWGIDSMTLYETVLRFNIATNFFSYDDIFPLVKLPYENTEFWAPRNYEKVLNEMFGSNWMEIPASVLTKHGRGR